MNQPTMESFVQRLDRLERENRQMKRIGRLMLVGIVGLVFLGQSQCNSSKIGVNQPTKVVEAQEFIVRDAHGQPRAKLTETALIFTNAAGKERIRLGAGDAITSLSLTDDGGPPSVVLQSCWAKNSVDIPCGGIAYGTGLVILTSEGKIALRAGNPYQKIGMLGQEEENIAAEPSLDIHGKDEKASIDLSPTGLSLIRNHRRRIFVDLDDNGPSISLFGNERLPRTRAVLGSTSLETARTGTKTQTSEASLILFDKDEKVTWRAPR